MTSARTAERRTTTAAPAHQRSTSRLYAVLIGLSSLAVLLQGLWAGLFVHEGQDYQQSWVDVHARGAEVAILLAAAATVTAYVKLRDRRDLLIGSAALTVLLVFEAYLGGLIGESPAVTVIHFPLAMALMGLAVWLPLRARSARR
jgi:heme A synthase